ncbi:MAG TPA: DNA polymerase III subunit gamma/tau [Saprospiraceae bacterium]|nr:DNA polymerase III subunit gamma/tau [Saprospiraceae bacterium]
MSQFVVSARKYRPLKFADVVGQEHVSQTLKNALQTHHLAHAFLFCGPRGVGKTTCARILAKIINCENPTKDFEACNVCGSCKAFNENASFNIIELDAASNNSVENIRALTEQVRFQPQQGKYKVFIIDEVHMLSSSAFNAFLKTLEEPPPHAIFILATTEKHKIIPTILSRCQIFDFKRIQIKDIVKQLQDICRQEGIEATEKALHIIAQKADGAMRDALSIFDRIVSFAGQKVSYEDVIENLNVLDYDYFFRTTDCMLTEDAAGVMVLLEEIISKGFDPEIYMTGLSEHIRNLLVCKDPRTAPLLELSDDFIAKYIDTAALFSENTLLNCLSILNSFDINYRIVRNKRLHTELSLVRLVYVKHVHKMDKSGSQPALEKKTVDLKERVVQVAETQELVNNIATGTHATRPIAAEYKTKEYVNKSQASTAYDTPSLASLTDLKASISKKLDIQVEKKEITQTELEVVWRERISEIQSPSVKASLGSTLIRMENGRMVVTVESVLAKERLTTEKDIVDKIRKHFLSFDLMMEIEIDTGLSLEEIKTEKQKPLSAKEKYEKLVEQNPAVNELRKRLHLKIDEAL